MILTLKSYGGAPVKTIRSNKYRRKRRRSDRTKIIMALAIFGGALVIAAAIVVALIILIPKFTQPAEDSNAVISSVTEDTASTASADPADEIAAINPNAATAATTGKLSYQSLYPEMYVPIVEKIPAAEGAKVVYLTFDDGPSVLTEELLNVLDKQKVKATFFVSCHGSLTAETKRLLKEIHDRGHAIGIHTFSHDYTAIYKSVEAFLDDFALMNDVIYEAIGEKPTMFRFAGGSYNSYNEKNYKDIIAEMERRGYTYFDWNVDCGDSMTAATETSIYKDTVTGITSNNKSIVLMHNSGTKKATVNQIDDIIKKAKAEGYHFELLDPSVKPFSFAFPE